MENLIQVEYKNQRIMTTKVLAEQFGSNEQNISRNFTRNSERFIEGKHYFKLEGQELKEFKGYVPNDESLKFVSILYLWTDRGAARHAKILDTDEAWDVYEKLEENYFNPNNVQKQLSPMEQLRLQYQVLNQHEEKITEVESKVNTLENNMTIDHGQACNIKLTVDLEVKKLCCGNESAAYQNKKLRSKIYRFVWKSIKDYFNVTAYHNLRRKDMDQAINYIKNLNLQGGLLREVQQANNQMCFS